MARTDWVVFLGPSLPDRKRLPEIWPPAAAGDILRALRQRPRALVLIDGVFEGRPSVWHREILVALDAGVAVFGAASMGALRAVELAPFGMVGVGQVFRWYQQGVLQDDSEVALLHADAEHGHRPLTVPLVNVRHNARRAVEKRLLSASEARTLVEVSRGIFYQERTWASLNRALAGVWHEGTLSRWEALEKEDLKAIDARACLDTAWQWLSSGAPALPPRVTPQTSFLRRRRVPNTGEGGTEGLRRLLLARWAKSMGLGVQPHETEGQRREWLPGPQEGPLQALGMDDGWALRVDEELALEQKLLQNSTRVLNDGPMREEGAWLSRLLSKPPRKRELKKR